MVEILQFVFGGTVLWGVPRFCGVLLLIALLLAGIIATAKVIRRK